MIKHSIIFNNIRPVDRLSSHDLFFRLLENEFSHLKGWGYSSLSLDGTLIMGTLLKSVEKIYKEWNPETSMLEKKNYTLIKEIDFRIDLEEGSFVVEGGVKDMNMVKQSLRQILYNGFTYTPIETSIYQLLEQFKHDCVLRTIEELVLINFRAENLFLGSYTAKPIDPYLPVDILKSYDQHIGRAKTTLFLSERSILLVVKPNGIFTVLGTEEDKVEIVNYLTSKLMHNG